MSRFLKRWLAPLLIVLAAGATSAATDFTKDTGDRQQEDKFSCIGRVAGFYADISSGCQMYHMCDEAGRVFTHACPERTLFQQRTMVCDHWYMVECNGADPTLRAALPPRSPGRSSGQLASLEGFPGRKRHSQRVLATFPYQRGNDSSTVNSPIRSSDKLESFKISSFPSSTQRIPVSSTATIERVERPTYSPITVKPYFQDTGETKFNGFTPVVARAKIERVFKEPVFTSTSTSNGVISQVQFSSSFREPKAGTQFVSTSRPSTKVSPSLIENKYNSNPYFESYFRTSFNVSTSTPANIAETTTQSLISRDEEENSENRVEIVIPDPRKMFYIPDSNYDPGDASKEEGTVLVIELPVKHNTMKFEKVDVSEARNHDCPQCHPSFLIPGLCRPCVLIK